MNILPKKRWHVRTKENIARVRKDEAEAAEKERQEQLRIETADREARLNLLKQKTKQKLLEAGVTEPVIEEETPSQHINLFADYDNAIKTTNKDYDKEVKETKEEYEKKIGYLTYLGQDTNEANKKKNWYEVLPESSRFSRSSEIKDTYTKLVLKDEYGKPKQKEIDVKNGEVSWKSKQSLDPINAFKEYCHAGRKYSKESKKKEKSTEKHKSNKKDSKDKLQKLREARLKREKEEKEKTDLFLRKLSGLPVETSKKEEERRIKPKYNSQFNPELARQNYQ